MKNIFYKKTNDVIVFSIVDILLLMCWNSLTLAINTILKQIVTGLSSVVRKYHLHIHKKGKICRIWHDTDFRWQNKCLECVSNAFKPPKTLKIEKIISKSPISLKISSCSGRLLEHQVPSISRTSIF